MLLALTKSLGAAVMGGVVGVGLHYTLKLARGGIDRCLSQIAQVDFKKKLALNVTWAVGLVSASPLHEVLRKMGPLVGALVGASGDDAMTDENYSKAAMVAFYSSAVPTLIAGTYAGFDPLSCSLWTVRYFITLCVSFIEKMTLYAYAYVGIHGGSFVDGAVGTYDLLQSDFGLLVLHAYSGDVVATMLVLTAVSGPLWTELDIAPWGLPFFFPSISSLTHSLLSSIA